ncbi:MAG: hypothetical protein ACE5KZ_14715 [Candidatus Scalinduaceae bacterium]
MKSLRIIGCCYILLFLIPSIGFGQDSLAGKSKSYSNSKWDFSFIYPPTWDLYSNRTFSEMTHGLWNVPDAIVIVANTNDPEENFFVKANPAPSGTIPKSVLQDMIGSLDQQYRQRYKGFRKIYARITKMAGATGIEYVMDNERGKTKLRQMVLLLIKNNKSFIWTFTVHRNKYDRVNKEIFEVVLSSLRIK